MKLSELEVLRTAKLAEVQALVATRNQASREFTETEATQFDALEAEIVTLNATIARERKVEDLNKQTVINKSNRETPEAKASKSFSFTRAIDYLAKGKTIDGVEAEMSQEAEKEVRGSGQSINGIGIPSWMLNIKGSNVYGQQKRDLTAGDAGTGAEYIQTLEIGHQYGLEIAPKFFSLGVEVLKGLTSNVYITETGEATAVWETEVATNDETTPVTSKPVNLSPKRLGAFTDVSKQLLIQTSGVAEMRVKTQLEKAINRKLDYTIANGTGVAPIPKGILATVGINSLPGLGVASRASFWSAWAEIAADNADIDTLGIVMPAANYAFLANAPIDAGSGRFVLEDGRIIGINAIHSNNMPAGTILMGVFNQFVVGQWGGIDLMVNPFTKGKEALIEVIVNTFFDMGAYRPTSFCALTGVTME